MGNKKNEDQIEINDVVEDNGKVQKNISKAQTGRMRVKGALPI